MKLRAGHRPGCDGLRALASRGPKIKLWRRCV